MQLKLKWFAVVIVEIELLKLSVELKNCHHLVECVLAECVLAAVELWVDWWY